MRAAPKPSPNSMPRIPGMENIIWDTAASIGQKNKHKRAAEISRPLKTISFRFISQYLTVSKSKTNRSYNSKPLKGQKSK